MAINHANHHHNLLLYVTNLKLCWIFLAFTSVIKGTLATQYTVGDTSGWNTGVDYQSWASKYTFKNGDSLLFSYGSLHSVLQVSESDYNACSAANAISSSSSGSTVVKLSKAQTYYFICGTPGHCSGGMQLSVAVEGSSTSPSTSSPTSTTPTTPSSTSSTTPSSTTSTTPSTNQSAGHLKPHSLVITIVSSFLLMTLSINLLAN